MRTNISWARVRDGLALLLAAGLAGILVYTWSVEVTGRTRSQQLAALESELRPAQQALLATGPAASRQRMAALEAELARLQQATPAQARRQTREAMQRWLDQNDTLPARETTHRNPRVLLGLAVVLAFGLLALTASRWLPGTARNSVA
ncbi:MAG TPA: hypothetical protein DD490_25505 [Acidobacteria bacterium]|nr:hypothetical protein [Acidobacteriota bacterium]